MPPASRREGTPEVPRLLVESSDVGKWNVPTRRDAGGTMTYSGSPPPIPWAHDLWLRDGDVIEVPEKL